jgi:hypothetical protein
MIKAEADLAKERMNILADQALTPEDLRNLLEQIEREACKLDSDWVAAVDLRGMWVENLFFCEQMALLQKTLLLCGARKIGTILDSTPIQLYLGQAGMKTRSNEVTQRFFNEKSWRQFIEGQ